MAVVDLKAAETLHRRILEVFLAHPDEEMYERVLDIVCEAVESPVAIFAYLDEEGAAVAHVMMPDAGDKPPAPGKMFRFPPDRWGDGLWSRALRSKKSVYANTSRRVPEGHFPVRRALVVPIVDHGVVIGHFELANKPTDYDDQDAARLESIAAYVAPVLRARLERDTQKRKRRQAETGLCESEARYRALVENVQVGINLIDAEYNVLMVNTAQARMFRKVPAEFVGQKCFRVFEQREAVCEHCPGTPAMASGQPHEGESSGVRTDGSPFAVRIQAFPLHAANGAVAGFIEIVEDITDRKQAEAALREQEAFLEKAQQVAGLGTWVSDVEMEGRLIWSPNCYGIFGHTADTFDGRVATFFSAVHPDDREAVSKAARAAREGRCPYQVEHRIIRPDGDVRWVAQAAVVEHDGEGRPIRMLGIVQDITDRKRAEAELQRLNEELERRVRERTAELQAANKDLEAFTYTVSHDLRAPLRHVSGFVELLEKHSAAALDETGQRYLRLVVEAAQRMGQLIDDLLAFSRAGRADLQKTMIRLDQLVQEAQAELQDEMAGRQIEWQIDPLPEVYADRNMLRLVLVNLLSNALKFTRPRPRAKIEIRAVPEGHEELVILVRDNGVGFDMRYLHRLFNVFQRLHRADEFEGTGIGLASVRRIVQRHGGRTWAEGTVDGGARFYFALPIGKADRV